MKGQRLFVRETAAEDENELREFYRSEALESLPPLDGAGVMARLVGDLVAHMSWTIDGNRALITHIHVTRRLRKKRIGFALLFEASQIATRLHVHRLVVSGACPARDFFLRTGFAEADGDLVREVS